MTESPLAYIPTDRRHALARGVDLPHHTTGAALFADISGFTPLTEALVRTLGVQRGAEQLLVELNRIYDALVTRVDEMRGSVVTFSGDAMTCWFDDDGDGGWQDDTNAAAGVRPSAVQRAVACGFAIQSTMSALADVQTADGAVELAVKVAVAAGPVVRFVVGDPDLHVIDVMAGDTLQRLAAGEHHADRGEVVIDEAAATALGDDIEIGEWRTDHDPAGEETTDEGAAAGDRFAVVAALRPSIPTDPWPALDDDVLTGEQIRQWLIPPVAARLAGGMGEYFTELRPAVSLFIRFDGIDYDRDDAAETQLDDFVRAVQVILQRYESYVLQITIGDKGSYINTAFGAPMAHGDDAQRAVAAAIELRELSVPPVGELQIGIARGRTRTGACGSVSRRQYSVMGDEVNVSARLMSRAAPNEVLADQQVRRATASTATWVDLPPMTLKGKTQPFLASSLVGARERPTNQLHLPEYALPMIGRQAQLETVVSCLDAALAGRGQVVGIVADAGMGKSRLLAEVLRRTRDRGLSELGGECQSYGVNASYLVWHNIWRAFFDIDGSLSTTEQIAHLERQVAVIDPALVDRVPLLGPAINLPIPDNDLTDAFDAQLRKTSLESLLVQVVRARAQHEPVLFVLEDCHWLDALSHDLLEVLGRAIVDVPVLIITAYRPALAAHLEAPRISELPHFTEVRLDELETADLARLTFTKLQQLYGEGTEPRPELVEELSSRSQGNPFYLEELLNFLKDRGVDPEQPDALLRLDLPDSLYSLILGRIDQLTEDQRTLLKVASVIGRLFQVAMLWGVYRPGNPQDELLGDLITLAEMELTAIDTPEPELAYLFKHVLTQEVAYETLPFATRAVLHDQIGQFIEALYPGVIEQHLDLLAHHYDRSENLAKRREFLRRAGESAQATSANVSAISYFERVIPLLDGADQQQVLMRLGSVLELVGEWAAAETAVRSALDLADAAGDVLGRGRAERALGVLDRKRGSYPNAVDWMTRARASYELVDELAGQSLVMADLGEIQRLQGRYGEARERYDDSLRIATTVVEDELRDDALAYALKGAGTVATWQGDYDAARSLNEQSLQIRRAQADQPAIAVLLNNQGIVARFQHDLDDARRLNDESIAVFRQIGDRWAVGQLLNNQACVAADQGDHIVAQALLVESLEIRRQLGDRVGLALSLNTLADVLVDIAQYDAAVPLLDESMAIDRELGDQTAIAYLLEDYAGIAAAAGRAERAVRLAGFAAALRNANGAPLPPNEQARVDRMIDPARSALDPGVADTAWAEGQRLGAVLAVDEVLALG